MFFLLNPPSLSRPDLTYVFLSARPVCSHFSLWQTSLPPSILGYFFHFKADLGSPCSPTFDSVMVCMYSRVYSSLVLNPFQLGFDFYETNLGLDELICDYDVCGFKSVELVIGNSFPGTSEFYRRR